MTCRQPFGSADQQGQIGLACPRLTPCELVDAQKQTKAAALRQIRTNEVAARSFADIDTAARRSKPEPWKLPSLANERDSQRTGGDNPNLSRLTQMTGHGTSASPQSHDASRPVQQGQTSTAGLLSLGKRRLPAWATLGQETRQAQAVSATLVKLPGGRKGQEESVVTSNHGPGSYDPFEPQSQAAGIGGSQSAQQQCKQGQGSVKHKEVKGREEYSGQDGGEDVRCRGVETANVKVHRTSTSYSTSGLFNKDEMQDPAGHATRVNNSSEGEGGGVQLRKRGTGPELPTKEMDTSHKAEVVDKDHQLGPVQKCDDGVAEEERASQREGQPGMHNASDEQGITSRINGGQGCHADLPVRRQEDKAAVSTRAMADGAEKLSKRARLGKPALAHHPPMNFQELLSGVVFAISGIQNPERREIREQAAAMGAVYRPDWDSGCTLLVCAFVDTPKFMAVKERNGTIVSHKWILECQKMQQLVDIEPFMLHAGRPWRTPAAAGGKEDVDDEDGTSEEGGAEGGQTGDVERLSSMCRPASAAAAGGPSDGARVLQRAPAKDTMGADTVVGASRPELISRPRGSATDPSSIKRPAMWQRACDAEVQQWVHADVAAVERYLHQLDDGVGSLVL